MKTYDVPQRIVDELERYRMKRLYTGSFLRAVLCNDLFRAVGNADPEGKENIANIVMYINNNFPLNIWGSEKKVDGYLNSDEPVDLRLVKQ